MKDRRSHKGLYDYAGRHKYLTFAGMALSGISALLALVPFIYIWLIIRDVLGALPDAASAGGLAHYGWMAVLFAALSVLVYVG